MFIKRSTVKIVSVIDEEELTEDQKKKAKDLSKPIVKASDQTDPSSEVKKSGS